MKRKDYYRILGVASEAEADTIKKAYRKLAMEYHPDRRPGDAKAMEKFKEIAEAYGVLGNPSKRADYDRQRMGLDGQDAGYARPYEAYEARHSHRRPTQSPRTAPDPSTEWTPPRPPRTPHIRPENEGLFKYAHVVSYGAVVVFALSLVCYMFYAISETNSQETRSASDRRNSANMMAAHTVTARVSQRFTQQAPTRTAIAQTATFDPVVNQRTLDGLPGDWVVDNHVGEACSIELDSGDTDCGRLSEIEVVYSYGGELLLRVDFDPARTDYRRVLFVVQYGWGKPTGWTVNIGDSRSNDGLGGDAGHQANNAEIQVNDGRFSIYAREGVPRASQELVRVEDAVEAGSALAIEVGNETVRWWYNALGAGQSEELVSPYLFALGGQADGKGGVNYQVYAAFDRVVSGSANRNGDGVRRVDIRLLP